jgi:hypothetical protein
VPFDPILDPLFDTVFDLLFDPVLDSPLDPLFDTEGMLDALLSWSLDCRRFESREDTVLVLLLRGRGGSLIGFRSDVDGRTPVLGFIAV